MAILISVIVIAAVLGFGVYAFGGIDRLRRGSGEQSAEMWYSRYADKRPRKRRRG